MMKFTVPFLVESALKQRTTYIFNVPSSNLEQKFCLGGIALAYTLRCPVNYWFLDFTSVVKPESKHCHKITLGLQKFPMLKKKKTLMEMK